jgi:hypothetical protein
MTHVADVLSAISDDKSLTIVKIIGEQIYRGQRIIEDALNIFWKLKALDVIALSDKSTEEEIIDSLIDNEEIKEILKKTSFDLLYLSKNYFGYQFQ